MSRCLSHRGYDLAVLFLTSEDIAVLGCDALGFMGPGLQESWLSEAQLFLWILLNAPVGDLEEIARAAGLRSWRIRHRGIPKPTNAAREDGAEAVELVHLDAVSWLAHGQEAA